MIVEIVLGGHQVVFAGQDGGDQFLGRGLAVCAGDADDRDVDLLAVVGREFLQHFQ